MCGIFGLIDFSGGASRHTNAINHATDLMSHRGHDGRGVWIHGAAGLGHRRLAIIDPTGSLQPMASSDGRYVLTYNGELYNFRELRARLIAAGIQFQTNGDTEVVLWSLISWGIEALPLFNGMFAFGLWDSLKNELIIARDRLGVKPLYYSSNRCFAFASEYPPLLSLDGISRNIDPVGIVGYLSHYQTNFEHKTIYRDITSLNGGEYAVYNQAGLKRGRYWELPIIPSSEKERLWPVSKQPEAATEVARLMSDAVARNSIADVDVGVFLSGGIDSAIITALMCEQSSERVKAYSIGFKEPGFNEFEFSREVTQGLGVSHKVVTFDDDNYVSLMLELISHKGAPLSTPNEIPIYSLSKLAAKKLKVVLTGEGSDELFGGYTGIFHSPIDFIEYEQLRHSPQSFPQETRDALRVRLRGKYGKTGFRNEVDHWTTTYAWLGRGEIASVLGEEFDLAGIFVEIDSLWQAKFDRLEGLDLYDRYLYLFETEHLRGLLTRLDSCTMAGSLEGRVPFTDNDLVDFVWKLPYSYKVKVKPGSNPAGAQNFASLDETLIGKSILRDAFHSRVSESIRGRTKKAFPVPLERWLNLKGTTDLTDTIRQLQTKSPALFSTKVSDWTASSQASGVGAMKIWMVWNLVEWLKTTL